MEVRKIGSRVNLCDIDLKIAYRMCSIDNKWYFFLLKKCGESVDGEDNARH